MSPSWLSPPPLRRSPAGGPVLQSLLQRRPLVLWPCRCRRGGAYSLINTPVTRVKPPQARAAPATPRQRGQERGRRSGLARRPDSPKLPAKPSIFREKKREWGRRPAGGSAHTAGLRPGFHRRDEPSCVCPRRAACRICRSTGRRSPASLRAEGAEVAERGAR